MTVVCRRQQMLVGALGMRSLQWMEKQSLLERRGRSDLHQSSSRYQCCKTAAKAHEYLNILKYHTHQKRMTHWKWVKPNPPYDLWNTESQAYCAYHLHFVLWFKWLGKCNPRPGRTSVRNLQMRGNCCRLFSPCNLARMARISITWTWVALSKHIHRFISCITLFYYVLY